MLFIWNIFPAVINSREESDEDEIDQDFQYNEKFEMMLQDDASQS